MSPRVSPRPALLSVGLLLTTTVAAGAQAPATAALRVGVRDALAAPAPAAAMHTARESVRRATATRERSGRRQLVWGVSGAVLGAGLGYFVSQVAHGSWEEDSRAGYRTSFALGGAAVGALGGVLLGRHGARGTETGFPAGLSAREYLSAEEMRQTGATNVLDAIRARRALWLRARGTDSFDETGAVVVDEQTGVVTAVIEGMPQIVVYLDEARLGSITRLRDFPISQVMGVRYYDVRQATFRWGAGHNHGAIQLLTAEP